MMQQNNIEFKPFTLATAKQIVKQEALESQIMQDEDEAPTGNQRAIKMYMNTLISDDQKRRMKTLKRLAARKIKSDATKDILVTAEDLC